MQAGTSTRLYMMHAHRYTTRLYRIPCMHAGTSYITRLGYG